LIFKAMSMCDNSNQKKHSKLFSFEKCISQVVPQSLYLVVCPEESIHWNPLHLHRQLCKKAKIKLVRCSLSILTLTRFLFEKFPSFLIIYIFKDNSLSHLFKDGNCLRFPMIPGPSLCLSQFTPRATSAAPEPHPSPTRTPPESHAEPRSRRSHTATTASGLFHCSRAMGGDFLAIELI
jgi:hypothetical protein